MQNATSPQSAAPSIFPARRDPNAAASAGASAGGATDGAVMERRQEEVRRRKEDRSSVGQTESWRAKDKRRRRGGR